MPCIDCGRSMWRKTPRTRSKRPGHCRVIGSHWKQVNLTEIAVVRSGYLCIETHPDHPGLIRLLSLDQPPQIGEQSQIRFVARFNDRDAALMHTHEILKRRLLDPDSHLYRTSIERAIAAIESLNLRHREIYADPAMPQQSRDEIALLTQRYLRRQQLKDNFFQVMGYLGLGLLLVNMLFLSVR